MPRDQAVVAQKVPPVPDRLLSERSSAPAVAPNPFVAKMPPAPAPETRTINGSLPAQVWPAPRAGSGTPAPAATLAPPPVVVAVPAPPPPVVMTVPSIGQAQAAQPPVLVEPPKPVEEAVARQPEATPLPIPVRVNTPISVKTNSWVELRAPNGDVLTQTYVRAGESYVVPAGIAYRITEAR